MEIRSTLRKIAELGIGVIAVSVVLLAGCGGGGGGGSSSSGTPVGGFLASFKGMFITCSATATDAYGRTVNLGSSACTNGRLSATFPAGTLYPVIVSVTGTYWDETTIPASSAVITPLNALRTVVVDATAAGAASGIPVTAITEIAVTALTQQSGGIGSVGNPLTAAAATKWLDVAATLLGIGKDHTTLTAPGFDSITGIPTDPDTVTLAALAFLATQEPGVHDLASQLHSLANRFALAAINNPTSAVADIITQAQMNAAIASAINPLINSFAPPPASGLTPTVTLPPNNPIGQIAPIVQARTLLTSLRTNANLMSNPAKVGFLDTQASGVRADMTAVTGATQGITNAEAAVFKAIGLMGNPRVAATLPSQILYNMNNGSGQCVISTTTNVFCQWVNSDPNGWTQHQLTVFDLGVTPGVGPWAWQDDIVAAGSGVQPVTTLPLSSLPPLAPSISLFGTATATITGTFDAQGNPNAGTTMVGSLVGDFQPSGMPTIAYDHNKVSLNIGFSAVASGANTVTTATVDGTISAVDSFGTTVAASITVSPGSSMVNTRVTAVPSSGHPVSGHFVGQFKTPNYQFDGTFDATKFAQDLTPAPFSNWYAGTNSFTGSITGINANSALGKFMTGTLTATLNRAAYNPTLVKSSSNFPINSGTFTGSLTNRTVTPAMTYQITNATDTTGTTSLDYKTRTTSLTYIDGINNTFTLTVVNNGLGTRTIVATFGGITLNITQIIGGLITGTVYAGATQIGVTDGVTVVFTDGSVVSLQ